MFEKMKELREYEGLTQEEVAKKLNVKRATYAGWECGKDIIPFPKLYEFAKLFHTTIDYIVGTCPDKEYTNYKGDINKASVSNNLKNFRKSKHLTQEKFAQSLNTSQANIYKYENGKSLITTVYVLEFSKQYHYSIDRLLKEKNN